MQHCMSSRILISQSLAHLAPRHAPAAMSEKGVISSRSSAASLTSMSLL